MRRSRWSEARDARLRELWPTNLTIDKIAAEINKVDVHLGDIYGAYVSGRRGKLGLPMRNYPGGPRSRVAQRLGLPRVLEPVPLSPVHVPVPSNRPPMHRDLYIQLGLTAAQAKYFRGMALGRGISIAQLLQRLMETVCLDNMVEAVLDDTDEVAAAQANRSPA